MVTRPAGTFASCLGRRSAMPVAHEVETFHTSSIVPRLSESGYLAAPCLGKVSRHRLQEEADLASAARLIRRMVVAIIKGCYTSCVPESRQQWGYQGVTHQADQIVSPRPLWPITQCLERWELDRSPVLPAHWSGTTLDHYPSPPIYAPPGQ